MIYYRRLNDFFGKGNYKVTTTGIITYKPVSDDKETIILRTKDVISFLDRDKVNSVRYALVTGNHRGIYLNHWQILNVSYRDETKVRRTAQLVKLTKKYSTIYSFAEKEFDNKLKEKNLEWKDLLQIAESQAKEKIKVKTNN